MADSPASPWIRAHEARELLSHSPMLSAGYDQQRVVSAFRLGLVRVQARSAHFSFRFHPSIVRYNWPIPTWIWSMRDCDLNLAQDWFYAAIEELPVPVSPADDKWSNLLKVELFELRFHNLELRRHFALPSTFVAASDVVASSVGSASPSSASTGPRLARAKLKSWLEQAFEDDPSVQKIRKTFRQEAFENFGNDLSGAEFDRTWREVVEDHPTRTARGRRRAPIRARLAPLTSLATLRPNPLRHDVLQMPRQLMTNSDLKTLPRTMSKISAGYHRKTA